MQWNEKDRINLISFLLFKPALLDAISKIEPQRLYQAEGEPRLAVILQALLFYKDTYDMAPSGANILQAQIRQTISQFPGMESDLEVIDNWVNEAYSLRPESLDQRILQQEIDRYVNEFLGDYYFKPKFRELASQYLAFNSLRERASELSGELFDSAVEKRREMGEPAAQAHNLLHKLKVVPAGVGVLDDLLSAGLRLSETYLILGPTGGGKSLLAVQLGISQAVKGRHVVHCTFEEPMKIVADPENEKEQHYSPFSMRSLGPLAGITREDLKDIDSFEDLPQPKKDYYWERQKLVKGNWKVLDYTTASPSYATFSALERDVRKIHEERKINLLVLDPLWPMVMNTASVKGLPNEPSALRAEAQQLGERFSRLSKELNTTLVVAHQLGASAAQQSASKLSSYSAAEIRTLAWRLENVIVISRVSDSGECALLLGKGRNSGQIGTKVNARLDGNANQFLRVNVAQHDEFVVDNLQDDDALSTDKGSQVLANFAFSGGSEEDEDETS